MTETGVIHGRFQVLHHDHLSYILGGKAGCQHLVVGITNPDPTLTRQEEVDPHRSLPTANPLTYYERYVMIRSALVEAGLQPLEFSIVPFPINLPDMFRYYVPLDATFFLTIYDPWGQRKLERFRAMGLRAEVLWTRLPHEKGLSGTEVRHRMAQGEDWDHMVPPSVGDLMKAWGIPERLRRLGSP